MLRILSPGEARSYRNARTSGSSFIAAFRPLSACASEGYCWSAIRNPRCATDTLLLRSAAFSQRLRHRTRIVGRLRIGQLPFRFAMPPPTASAPLSEWPAAISKCPASSCRATCNSGGSGRACPVRKSAIDCSNSARFLVAPRRRCPCSRTPARAPSAAMPPAAAGRTPAASLVQNRVPLLELHQRAQHGEPALRLSAPVIRSADASLRADSP